MPARTTLNFNFVQGKPGVPRIHDLNLDAIDTAIAEAMAYPYVPHQVKTHGTSVVDGRLVTQSNAGVGIKSLTVGKGLVITDTTGDGDFEISLAEVSPPVPGEPTGPIRTDEPKEVEQSGSVRVDEPPKK